MLSMLDTINMIHIVASIKRITWNIKNSTDIPGDSDAPIGMVSRSSWWKHMVYAWYRHIGIFDIVTENEELYKLILY